METKEYKVGQAVLTDLYTIRFITSLECNILGFFPVENFKEVESVDRIKRLATKQEILDEVEKYGWKNLVSPNEWFVVYETETGWNWVMDRPNQNQLLEFAEETRQTHTIVTA